MIKTTACYFVVGQFISYTKGFYFMKIHNFLGKIFILMSTVMLFSMPVYAEERINTNNHIYTYDEMVADIIELSEAYPDAFTIKSAGTTVDGRIIPEIILGNADAEHAVFVISSIHGREWMNTWMLMKSLEDTLVNYDAICPFMPDNTYRQLFQNCAIYLIPMTNPDGVTISQYGINGIVHEDIRANLVQMKGIGKPSRWKANANGVDLNRNFEVGFNTNIPAVHYRYAPCNEYYNGVSPYSEPETIAIKEAFDERTFDLAITFHSFEEAIYWDLGQAEPTRNLSLYYAGIAKKLTGYRLGEKSLVHGLDYNYFSFVGNTPALCIETGKVPCPLPYSQFSKIYQQNKDIINVFAADIVSRTIQGE